MVTDNVRYTAEQFVLMAASVDYTKGNKLNALHQMLTQAATDTARIAELTAEVGNLWTLIEDLTRYIDTRTLQGKDARRRIEGAIIARNALKEGK